MASQQPVFGIKLVTPDHFKYAPFADDFDSSDGRSTLMNFRNNTQGIAAAKRLCPGSQAVVYVSREKWFARAFEVTGTTADGQRVAELFRTPTFDMLAPTNPYNIFLPIRWLASVEFENRANPTAICERAEIDFKPNSFTFKSLAANDFARLFNAIPWTWRRDSKQPFPSAITATHTNFDMPRRSPVTEPWFEEFLKRIRHVMPLAERNHEDVVAELLRRLGTPANQIMFQQGRIDISVGDNAGSVRLVVEVKQDLTVTAQAARAREQAQIYGARVGCDHCAITDGDLWELHDLSRGEHYDQRYLGAFRLTAFGEDDEPLFGLLCEWLGV